MKKIKAIGLFLSVVCFAVSGKIYRNSKYPAYSAVCLESWPGGGEIKPENDKTSGRILAVNSKYLVVGDPEANKVIIFTRQRSKYWKKINEIYPPKGSVAEKIGYGFGSELAINEHNLIIKAFALGWESKKYANYDLAEIYTISLDKRDTYITPKKIKYPYPNKTSISSIYFIENNLAFAVRTVNKSQKKVNLIYIVSPIDGKIIKSIEHSKIQYDSSDEYDSFHVKLGAYKKILVLGNLIKDWQKSVFLIYPDGKLEEVNIVYNPEDVDKEKNIYSLEDYNLQTFAFSNELTAISRNFAGFSNTIVFQDFPNIYQFKTIFSSGVLDAHKSYVLISHRTAPGQMPSYKEGQPDHTLVEVKNNQILVKSVITWERHKLEPSNYKSPFISAFGVLGDEGVFTVTKSKLLYLPFENLPNQYQINLSICGEY